MKKIILMLLTAIACSLVIYICTCVRCELKRNEIMTEMQNRLLKLGQQANTITAAEYTPFLWDTEYTYVGTYPLDRYLRPTDDPLICDNWLNDVEHIQTFFYNNIMVFDTGVLRIFPWQFSNFGKEYPQNKFNLYVNEEYISISRD